MLLPKMLTLLNRRYDPGFLDEYFETITSPYNESDPLAELILDGIEARWYQRNVGMAVRNCQSCKHFGKTCAPFPGEDEELAQECEFYRWR